MVMFPMKPVADKSAIYSSRSFSVLTKRNSKAMPTSFTAALRSTIKRNSSNPAKNHEMSKAIARMVKQFIDGEKIEAGKAISEALNHMPAILITGFIFGAVVHNGFECCSVYQGNSFSDMALLILIPFLLNNGKTSCSVNWIEVKPSKSREVLSSNKIRQELKNSFDEIMVDEYQDTNELQDAILYLVSRNFSEEEANKETQTPNMFMVGDVKQSIYGFRQARPDIFTDKYKKFGRGDNQGKLIVLNKNFRSRQGVIDSVNTLFKKVMTENVCGIAYNEDEYLNFGAAHYPQTPEDDATELYLVKGDNEYEAQVAAEKIKELIDSKYQVFDKKTGKLRDITYSDICIITDRNKYLDKYKKILLSSF